MLPEIAEAPVRPEMIMLLPMARGVLTPNVTDKVFTVA